MEYLLTAAAMLTLGNLIQAFGVSFGATPCIRPSLSDSGVNEHPWSLNACCHTKARVKLPVPDNAVLCSTWVWMALSFVIDEWTWGSEWTGAHTQTEKVQDEWPNQNVCCHKCNNSCTYSKYYSYYGSKNNVIKGNLVVNHSNCHFNIVMKLAVLHILYLKS